MEKHITTPLTDEKVRELHAGDYVYLSGTVYTARDAAHKRLDFKPFRQSVNYR